MRTGRRDRRRDTLDEAPYESHDLNAFAAALRTAEHPNKHGMRTGWIADHLPDAQILGYLEGAIPGPAAITARPGSLGRAMQHTLLQPHPKKQWPHVEAWDLDWATADPADYQHHAPQWLYQQAIAQGEQPLDLDERRTRPMSPH